MSKNQVIAFAIGVAVGVYVVPMVRSKVNI